MAAQLRKAAKKGRGGDTMLAHINEDEARMLRMMGGAGTRNPHTGLLEFRGGPGSTKAGEHTYGGERPGGKGSAGGGDRPTITRGVAPAPLGPNERAYPGYTHTKQSSTGGQLSFENGRLVVSPTRKELEQQNDIIGAWDDWNGRSFWDKGLDMIAGPLYDEQMPDLDDPRTYWGGKYHTSTNPLASAAMIAGALVGVPGAGIMMQTAQDLTGLKTDVYHNPPSANYGAERYGMPAGPSASPSSNPMAGLSGERTGVAGTIAGPLKAPTPSIFAPQAPAAQPAPPAIFPPKPPVQTPFQVAGGKPYGFSLFSRAA